MEKGGECGSLWGCLGAIFRTHLVTGGRSPIFSKSESHSVMSDSAAPWTAAGQIPLSMEFSRQECWSGWPFPSPGDLPNPGTEPTYPALQADSLSSEPPGKLPSCRAEVYEGNCWLVEVREWSWSQSEWNEIIRSASGVGCWALFQGIFPIQGSKTHLLLLRWILYQWVTWETLRSGLTLLHFRGTSFTWMGNGRAWLETAQDVQIPVRLLQRKWGLLSSRICTKSQMRTLIASCINAILAYDCGWGIRGLQWLAVPPNSQVGEGILPKWEKSCSYQKKRGHREAEQTEPKDIHFK